MYATVNDIGKLEIHTTEKDLCFKCKNIYKCPLIHSISQELVILHYSDTEIVNCGLYKK